ncbi:hypothetical protein [Bacteroides reticulotermitis]|uniref:hypothetical protein n=1 Tax=Bacteroides reticulotermitis TaxID=1133319 RepID=UPI003A83A649
MKKQTILFFFLTLLPCALFAQSDSIGIYMLNGDVISQIEPIKNNGYKANTLGAAVSMGIANSTIRVTFKEPTSKNKANRDTSFYFYYNPNIGNNARLLMTYYMFATGVSPEVDFSLVKFIKKGKTRELKTGTVNVYAGVNINTETNTNARFLVTKVSDIKYKVTLHDVDPGEYCFMYDGINGSGAYMPVFDFSIE